MTYELLIGLVAFALVASITPGPNNLMLMASGANFGFYRTVPHMLGVGIGFSLMVVLVGVGLVQLFDAYPLSHTLLKVVSVAYLLYLAARIATAGRGGEQADSSGRPFSFAQAALFQWVNPKAWTMALTAVSVYSPTNSLGSVLAIAAVFGLVNIPSISLWTVLGQQLRRLLNSAPRLRLFNGVMALLLVASLYPVLVA